MDAVSGILFAPEVTRKSISAVRPFASRSVQRSHPQLEHTAILKSAALSVLLEPVAYSAEANLHDLGQEAPQMPPLAGSPRLTVLEHELQLATGSADLLAAESTGRVVIIEVKLAESAESRQAVVAQVLSYARSRRR